MAKLDQDGQPVVRAYFEDRVIDRDIDEIIGLCRGVIADGRVDQSEAEYILRWLEANKEAACHWPCNVLAARVSKYLDDGHLDNKEAQDLLETMAQITGDNLQAQTTSNLSTSLFDNPPSEIEFNGSVFCLTGKFVFGSRRECEQEVERLGGIVKKEPSKKVNYLVIGCIGSEAWIHSSFGRKIEKAKQLQNSGVDIYIVLEDRWAECLID